MSKEVNQESVETLLLQTITSIVSDENKLLFESINGRFAYQEAIDTLSQAYQRIKSVNK